MYFFKQCSVCGQSILAGWRQRGERRYCSRACADFSTHRGFCNTCLQQTEDESSGAMSINQIGTSFVGSWNRCATCGSVESLKVLTILVPIFALARYRVLRFPTSLGASAHILSRRLPGPAMTRQIWLRLGATAALAVALWALFIGFLLWRQPG